jgi:hypothetical protein
VRLTRLDRRRASTQPPATAEGVPIYWVAPDVESSLPDTDDGVEGADNGAGGSETDESVPARLDLGPVPVVALTMAVGLAVCAIGDALSRSTRNSSQYLFWVALAIIIIPAVFFLCLRSTSRGARVTLVVMLGLALYVVRIMYSPFGFTFADEFIHAGNVNQILRTHALFGSNSLLPITPRYPGLESTTAALSSLSGASVFVSGLIVVGAARLVLMLALFLLFERVTGSTRMAALGAAFYAANANFLFFDAQFSYESVALPLFVVVLYCVAEHERDSAVGGGEAEAADGVVSIRERRAWGAMIVLVAAAIVITHHLTSYALVITLVLLAMLAQRYWRTSRLWIYAAFAVGAVAVWSVVAGSAAVGYLRPVFTGAFRDTFRTISGESSARGLFESAQSGYQVAYLERIVAIGSVLLIAAAWPFGARAIWRHYRRNPFAVLLLLASVAFFGMLALRFAPAAWETASRSSEFLFLGIALVLALVGVAILRARPSPFAPAAVAALFALTFAGGVISGSRPDSRMSQPLRVRADGRVIEPQGTSFARWTLQQLGEGRRFAASETDARLLVAYANQFAVAGVHPDVRDILQSTTLEDWQIPLLRRNHLRYVVVDRSRRSFDTVSGPYFTLKTAAPDLLPVAVARKFDLPSVDRLYDDGVIVLYDLSPDDAAPAKR